MPLRTVFAEIVTYMNTEQLESSTDELQPKLEVSSKEETDKSKNEDETMTDGSKEIEDRNEEDIRQLSRSSKHGSKKERSLKGRDSGILSPGKQLVKYDHEVCSDCMQGNFGIKNAVKFGEWSYRIAPNFRGQIFS